MTDKKQDNRLGQVMSPIGIAGFNWVSKPSTAFNENVYKCMIIFPDTSEIKDFIEQIKEMAKQAAKQQGVGVKQLTLPLKKLNDKTVEALGLEGVEAGMYYIEPKSSADVVETIPVFDAAKNDVTGKESPWKGDKVRAIMNAKSYSFGGKSGVKFYLNQVQIAEVGPREGGGGMSFDALSEEPTFDSDGGDDELSFDSTEESAPFDGGSDNGDDFANMF